MSLSKNNCTNITNPTHHCQLILSYWCRLLNIHSIQLSDINSILCKTIISYRGPGDIIAFSSNGTLSSIEIYNSILNNQPQKPDPDHELDISHNLCIKPVHINIKLNPIHKNNINYNPLPKINKNTWHPTLCATLDYHYIYRIGGGDPFKALLGESSHNVDIFNLHNLTQISLPPMTQKRAKCSATILPPHIPFHNYNDNHTLNSKQNCMPNIMQLFKNFKAPNIVPIPPKITALPETLNLNQKKFIPPTPPPNKPIPALPDTKNQAPAPAPIPLPPISILPSSSSPATTPPVRAVPVIKKIVPCDKIKMKPHLYPDYCVFVSGGLNGNTLYKKCEIFYPFEGQWNSVMSMKQGRCGHITQYMGATQWKYSLHNSDICVEYSEWKDISDLSSKVFVCGGKREHGNGITSCESFDIETNKWNMCKRAPFTNHGYQSGCWLTNKQCIAMISDPMDGNKVAIYKPEVNRWHTLNNDPFNSSSYALKANMNGDKVNVKDEYNLIHFYPLIGTLWLCNQEYLYIMGDDYKCKSLEIYDDRIGEWIVVGVECKVDVFDSSIHSKYDELLELTKYKQFDAFISVS